MPVPEHRRGSRALAIARAETAAVAKSPLYWAATALVVAVAATLVLWQLETYDALQARLRATPGSRSFHDIVIGSSLSILLWLIIIVQPLIAARAIVEERVRGTLMLMFASPASAFDIVVGKFLAHSAAACLWVLLVSAFLFTLSLFFPLDRGQIVAASLGLALASTAITAVATLCSCAFAQVTSAVLAALALLAVLAIGGTTFAGAAPDASRLGLFGQIAPMFLGIVPVSALVCASLVTVGALAAATLTLVAERYLG